MRAPYVADVDGLDGCSHQGVSVAGEGHAGGEGVREACGACMSKWVCASMVCM